MEEQIYRFILGDVSLDKESLLKLALSLRLHQMHRQLLVDGMRLEDLYDVNFIERTIDTPNLEQDSVFVSCVHCKQQTGSRRMVTFKKRQDAARETERKQQKTPSKPQIYNAAANRVKIHVGNFSSPQCYLASMNLCSITIL
ncbi:hypothetical protein CCR75_001224 [Bremia lactucae]|uniref:Uncharacterized protein n=1 Tax=Bremia lactucae TaxID=4779 RepID=A0A976FQ23_BRELC|nr:hypothetical protein CCR75_001224 [Bremia lactucae]